MGTFQWLDPAQSPILHLKSDKLELRLQPIEQHAYDRGIPQCNLEVILHHSTGDFRYQAGDVYFIADDIILFGRDLKVMISYETFETQLTCRGTEFDLQMIHKNRRVKLKLILRDNVVFPPGEGVLKCDFVYEDTEFIHWWRNAIDEFKPKLDEWLLENPPRFG